MFKINNTFINSFKLNAETTKVKTVSLTELDVLNLLEISRIKNSN